MHGAQGSPDESPGWGGGDTLSVGGWAKVKYTPEERGTEDPRPSGRLQDVLGM